MGDTSRPESQIASTPSSRRLAVVEAPITGVERPTPTRVAPTGEGSGTSAVEVVARVLHPGTGSGSTFAIAPVSFWGGVDAFGEVADVHHSSHGESLVGRAVVVATSKGSSSGSSVLAELIVSGRGPALMVVSEPDAVVVSGCLAAAEISGILLPVVQVTNEDLVRLGKSSSIAVDCAETPIGDLTRVMVTYVEVTGGR